MNARRFSSSSTPTILRHRGLSNAGLLYAGVVLCGLFSGCSAIGSLFASEESTRAWPVRSVELSLARSSLQDAEFEHYKLVSRRLFAECGTVKRNRFTPKEQEIIPIGAVEQGPVGHHVGYFLTTFHEKEWEWTKPGTASGLTDPGILNLTIDEGSRTITVNTSLDSISDPRTSAERALRRVVQSLRSLPRKPLCGNKSFYGLGYLDLK